VAGQDAPPLQAEASGKTTGQKQGLSTTTFAQDGNTVLGEFFYCSLPIPKSQKEKPSCVTFLFGIWEWETQKQNHRPKAVVFVPYPIS